ncbi:apolipoprotein N-acyltransferase [Acetobacteraceae bacterium]|nr:apolipoprotein N-acyltransferase [Acetobacteraceae bacterium]
MADKAFLKRAEKSWWGFLAAGALGALSLPPWYGLIFLPFSLFFLWHGAVHAPNWKKTLWWGFLYGMGWHVTDLYWLTDAILTRVEDFWWAVPIAAPGVSLLIAPLMALPALAARLPFSKKIHIAEENVPKFKQKAAIASLLLFAGMWPLSDLIRTYIFTGFPWNPPGSALAFPGLIGNICLQPASWIGVDGLTFFLVLFCVAPFLGRKSLLWTLVGVLLYLSFGSVRYYFPPKEANIQNPNVLMVQNSVAETEIFTHRSGLERFKTYLDLTRGGVAKALNTQEIMPKPLVVAWPESAFPFLLDETEQAQEMMAQAAQGHWIISGSLREDSAGRIYNTAQAISPEGEDKFIYAKSRLVPFGEYQPGIIPFNVLPDQLTPGNGVTTWSAKDLGSVSPLVCYEMIFPGRVASLKNRPGWILTISNDAWYSNSAGPWQHMTAGRLRSVEEGLPLVFVNNFGPSVAYSPQGKEISKIGWGEITSQLAPLPAPFEPTFFAKFGRLIAVLMSIFSCLVGIGLCFYKRGSSV